MLSLLNGDCLELFKTIASDSIPLILCDLPYGTTQNKWDSIIPLPKLWEQYNRVLAPNGAIVLTCAQPFTSTLVASNLSNFKYEWIWEKSIPSGHLNAKHQPMRNHESVLVFAGAGKGKENYYPQMGTGKPYKIKAGTSHSENYGEQKGHDGIVNTGTRNPQTVLLIPNPRFSDGHPTQKPVELMKYMIKTYSKPGEIVLDNCMGSGTTGEAAIQAGRSFIGMEMNAEYFALAKERIETSSEDEVQVKDILGGFAY